VADNIYMRTQVAVYIILAGLTISDLALAQTKPELKALACKVAKQHNIDCLLFKAIITQESNWKIDAVNKRSSDYGLTQINIHTIKAYGFDKTKLLTNAEYSLQAGAKVLSYFKKRYYAKDKSGWFSRYNCGTSTRKKAACYKYQSKIESHLLLLQAHYAVAQK
jgi:soluble lytic murein transglycosylase-like protein